ncbi:MAG: hypothetical protein HQL28_07440, partial [Candidatus Omnitrophica bacterium]|nr:hypothetical protein [Candidatus Omnitrophota bacterium]
MKKYAFLKELVLGFLIVNCLNFIFTPADPGFSRAPLNPYWVIVILISCRYGLVPGTLAGLLACCNMIILQFGGFQGRNAIEKIIENQGLIVPAAFVITGVFVGGIRQKYMDNQKDTELALETTKTHAEALKQKLDEKERTQKILEARIIKETGT